MTVTAREWDKLPRSVVRMRTVQEPAEAAQAIIELRAEVERLDAAHRGAVEALREIVAADPVDLALDPNRPQRIASEALRTLDHPGGQ